ncbi:MAG: general secretion pathway protein GspB [Nevskiales bacterium]
MSYILDALQRADQERNLGEVPKLDTALQSSSPAQKSSWLATGAMIVIVATVVASVLFMLQHGYLRIGSPNESTPGPMPVEATAPATPAAEAVTPQPKAEAQPTTTAAPAKPPPQALAAEPAATEQAPAAVPPAPKPVARAEPPAAAKASQKPREQASEKSKSQRLPTPTVAPAPPPSWVRKNTPEPAQRPPPPSEPVQSYLGLPESFRSRLPKLDMNAHVFSTNPARSFVLINSKRYRIGDYLAEGPELIDILPDGAVLDYRGEVFLLPVGR